MLNQLAIEELSRQFDLPFDINDKLLNISLLVPSAFKDYQKDEDMVKSKRAWTSLLHMGAEITKMCINDYVFFKCSQNPHYQSMCEKVLKKDYINSFLRKNHFISECVMLVNDKMTLDDFENESVVFTLTAYMYITFGYDSIYRIVEREISGVNINAEIINTIDAKTLLQEIVQAKHKVAPFYETVEESGEDHHKRFVVIVRVGRQVATGTGKSKKEASVDAANNMLRLYYSNEYNNRKSAFKKEKYVLNAYKQNKNFSLMKTIFPGNDSILYECIITKAHTNERKSYLCRAHDCYIRLGMSIYKMSIFDILFSDKNQLYCEENVDHLLQALVSSNQGFDFIKSSFLRYFEKQIICSSGEANNGISESVKTDVLKSLFSAGFVTKKYQGAKVARIEDTISKEVQRKLVELINRFGNKSSRRDARTSLQEICQALHIEVEINSTGSEVQQCGHEEWFTAGTLKYNGKALLSEKALSRNKKIGVQIVSDLLIAHLIENTKNKDPKTQTIILNAFWTANSKNQKLIYETILTASSLNIFDYIETSNNSICALDYIIKNKLELSECDFIKALNHIRTIEELGKIDMILSQYSQIYEFIKTHLFEKLSAIHQT